MFACLIMFLAVSVKLSFAAVPSFPVMTENTRYFFTLGGPPTHVYVEGFPEPVFVIDSCGSGEAGCQFRDVRIRLQRITAGCLVEDFLKISGARNVAALEGDIRRLLQGPQRLDMFLLRIENGTRGRISFNCNSFGERLNRSHAAIENVFRVGWCEWLKTMGFRILTLFALVSTFNVAFSVCPERDNVPFRPSLEGAFGQSYCDLGVNTFINIFPLFVCFKELRRRENFSAEKGAAFQKLQRFLCDGTVQFAVGQSMEFLFFLPEGFYLNCNFPAEIIGCIVPAEGVLVDV